MLDITKQVNCYIYMLIYALTIVCLWKYDIGNYIEKEVAIDIEEGLG